MEDKKDITKAMWDEAIKRLTPKLFWLTLIENTETGDNVIEHIDNVEEYEVKYATARLVTLAQARGIEIYSIEIATGVRA